MFNYIISYVIFSVGVCFSQVVNPVVINVQADSSVRAGEVVNININAEMDSQWKIYSIYEIVDGPLATEIGITGEVIVQSLK
jgi:hypothetical protein